MKLFFIALAIIALSACTAVPKDTTVGELTVSPGVVEIMDENPDAEAISTADEPRVRCRQVHRVGSHLTTRRCQTVDEIAKNEEDAKRHADKLINHVGRPKKVSSDPF